VQKNQQGQGGPHHTQPGSQPADKPTSSGGSNQHSQSGGGRDQQGSNVKSDSGQAQSRSGTSSQQGGEHGSRSSSDKAR
jgi:hypothetical protein